MKYVAGRRAQQTRHWANVGVCRSNVKEKNGIACCCLVTISRIALGE